MVKQMARSFKRDKIGRFAPTGNSGTSSRGSSLKNPKTQHYGSGYSEGSRSQRTDAIRKSNLSGADRKLSKVDKGRPHQSLTKSAGSNAEKARKFNAVNQSSSARFAATDKRGLTSSSGASSRGKSLRQVVAAKRGVAATTKASGGLEQTTPKSIRGGDSGKKVLKGATYRDRSGAFSAHGKTSEAAVRSLGKYQQPTAAMKKKSNELLAKEHRKSIAASPVPRRRGKKK